MITDNSNKEKEFIKKITPLVHDFFRKLGLSQKAEIRITMGYDIYTHSYIINIYPVIEYMETGE